MRPSSGGKRLEEALGASMETMDARARAEVRARVLAEARKRRRGFFVTLPQRLVAGVALASMLSGGVAYALGEAMPGDALYPLKRASESALVGLLPSGRLERQVLVGIAARRAEEASRLGESGDLKATSDQLRELERAVEQASGPQGTLTEDETAKIREGVTEGAGPTHDAIDQIVPPVPGDGSMQPQPDMTSPSSPGTQMPSSPFPSQETSSGQMGGSGPTGSWK